MIPLKFGLLDSLRGVLADGDWHRFGDIYAAVADTIPPERAARAHASSTHAARAHRHRADPDDTWPLSWRIKMGKRSMIATGLSHVGAQHRGPRGDDREYHLPPGAVRRRPGRPAKGREG